MSESVQFGVAIVGCGTVGGAAAQLLTRDREVLAGRCAPAVVLRYVVDVNFDHARSLGLDEALFCTDIQKVLDDKDVHVVVELIGGQTIARDVMEKALRAGKHVVTANKALLAHAGAELYALARRQNVSIAFEASCAGGIPIIRALTGGLIANRLDALYGIVNGTCNFILTEMTTAGRSYADVLAEAQKAGLAEADPTLDVSGEDSAHKLAILASLAFGRKIDYDAIPVEGIDTLELCDVAFGQQLGYVVKLLAIASRQDDGLSLRVRPAFISKEHPLAWVSGPFNAVSVYGHATGHTMYYGRGAGGKPTASAVAADILSLAMGAWQNQFAQLKLWPDLSEKAEQLPIEAVQSRYYLRITCQDAPGVFGQIAAILGKHEISITSVLQQEPHSASAGGVPVIITTHHAREGNVRNAVAEIDALNVVKGKSVCIGIVEEYPEEL
ncbi:MAG: homoserine dehydrogenase [Phycisphaerae bacterium]|nr:homoserine dehydrogenase [Phycisphaerae bacterium]